MGLLNLSLNFVSYSDAERNADPRVKFCDFHWSLLGIPFSKNPKEEPISLAPGETKTILTTERPLAFNSATSFEVLPVTGTSRVRILGSFGQRLARDYGDETTQWSITKAGVNLATATYVSGTEPDFASFVVGDGLAIDVPFLAPNRGHFSIVKVGSNFIQFTNPYATEETVVGPVSVFSSGPVQVGDVLDLQSPQFLYPNRGQFEIVAVTDRYVEIVNPEAVAESVTGVTSGLSICPVSYKWMLMAVDRKVIVRLNNDSGSGVEVSPESEGSLERHPGLFLKRGRVFKVEVFNPNQSVAEGFIFLTQ